MVKAIKYLVLAGAVALLIAVAIVGYGDYQRTEREKKLPQQPSGRITYCVDQRGDDKCADELAPRRDCRPGFFAGDC